MNLPSGLHDLLVISGLFSQAKTAEAATMIRKSSIEILNTIDKSYQYLGKILAIYLDEKAQIAGWFEADGYWEQPLSRERYPEITAASALFNDWLNHLDQVEILVLRFCILQGFKGPFKNPQNPMDYRDAQAATDLLNKFNELTGKLTLSNSDTIFI